MAAYGSYPKKPDQRHIVGIAASGADETHFTKAMENPSIYVVGWRAE